MTILVAEVDLKSQPEAKFEPTNELPAEHQARSSALIQPAEAAPCSALEASAKIEVANKQSTNRESTSEESTTADAEKAKVNPWILNPTIDTLFACGGLVWLLFGLHYFVFGTHSRDIGVQALVMLVIVGTHFLSETHNVATLHRIYQSEEKKRFSFYTKQLALSCGCLAIAGLFVPSLVSIFAKIYLIWVSQHFTAQTYGLALLYCYKRNYTLSPFEKNVFSMLMQATCLFAIVRQLTYFDWGGGKFIGIDIPFWGPLPEPVFVATSYVLAGLAAAFAFIICKKAIVEKKVFPMPAFLITLTGILIWIFGKDVTGTLWLYVPAFYHGSQYLATSIAYYLKEKGLPDSLPTVQIARALSKPIALKYFASLALIGTFTYIGIPHILEQVGVPFDLSFATIFCCINFHHFLTDAAIWKLRDKRTRDVLLA